MARNKVKLAWIVNDVARKSSFRKRWTSLFKKMSEITTLCDVGAFLILYSPDSDEPTLWPDRSMVDQLLARFQSMPEVERWKKMMNQENYLKERAAKMEEQIRKITKQNNELNMNEVLYQVVQKGKPLSSFETEDLTSLVVSMENRMKDIRKRIDYLEQNDHPNHPPCVTHQEVRDDQFENMSQSEGNFAESLFWYKELGNRIENPHGLGSSVRSDIGLPSYTCFGSSIAPNDIGFPNQNAEAKNYSGSYKMIPQVDFGGLAGGYDDGVMGHLPNQGNVGGIDAGLPPRVFGGSNAGSDVGLPYDVSESWKDFSSD